MKEENADIEFNELLADKRHKELKKSLEGIAVSLNQKKDNGIKEALEKQASAINGFAEAIKSLPAPNVNVSTPEINIDLSSIKEIANKILEGQNEILAELKILNLPKETKLEFTRGAYSDLIQSPIKATTTYSKTKAQA